MGELLLFRESGTTPELNTLRMNGCEVSPLGRPLDKKLRPVRTVDDILGRMVLVVPENANLVSTVKGKLITRVGVCKPRAEMLLLLERLDGGGLVLFVNAPFATVAFDIH